ncbi:hypothetical protein TIFTF001_030566 [Ficus carica]|uniref:Uncharacterized protein n=1 Tax=Ficus carica TaxID=3494 RepID=A0AA88DTG8_FICCA|nr:hypothetical protein TIFTF001_030566 [Ficus carica]
MADGIHNLGFGVEVEKNWESTFVPFLGNWDGWCGIGLG